MITSQEQNEDTGLGPHPKVGIMLKKVRIHKSRVLHYNGLTQTLLVPQTLEGQEEFDRLADELELGGVVHVTQLANELAC